MIERRSALGDRNRAGSKLARLKYDMVAEAAQWYTDNNGTEDEKEKLRNCCEKFSKAVLAVINHVSQGPDLNTQTLILSNLETVMLTAHMLGNLSRTSPFMERRQKLAKRQQTANGRSTRDKIAKQRLPVIATYANALWKLNPKRNGNACGTANEIAERTQAALAALDQRLPYGSLEKAREAIRKQLPTVEGWKPRGKTGGTVQRSS
ncbi:MAG: hypothetical protein WDN46_07205 [Methylocella sp.]